MAGLVRLVSESFGTTLGSALIYTVGGMLLLIVRRPKPISQAPRKYLVAGGLMFIAYEASISLSIGLATTNAQSVEVSLVNYLWPTLLVLMTAAVSHKRGSVSEALPGAIVATVGVAMAVGGENLDVQEAVANIASNPLPYALAFAGAFIWAIYATVTPSMSGGYDGTTIFFCCVAVVLWIIHFVSGDGLPAVAPGIGGYIALLACAAVLHCFQHAPIGRDVGHAILDRCRAGGGRLADQRVVCTTPLIVRFCRIGRLLVCEEATCGVVAAQRYVREVTGQDNALTHPR